MNFDSNQILITGANGWLGKTLIHSLLNGIKNSKGLDIGRPDLKIRCLVLPGENTNDILNISKNAEIFQGDITKIEDCEKFMKNAEEAILFHCAGIIHPKRVKEFYDINVQGTNNILSSAVKEKLKRVIVISSNSPCGTNSNNDYLFDENQKYNPYLNYGRSKMQMEKTVKRFVNEGKIEATIIRPPWFYGPYQPNRQIRFYKMIKDGRVPTIGNGNNMRSMACTINISQGAIRAALTQEANGNIYWISDQKPYSYNEIISTIRSVMEKEFGIVCRHNTIKLPSVLSDISYLADYLIQSTGFYNKEIHVLSEMNKTIACSIKKAESELNYNPTFNLYNGTVISIKSIESGVL